MSSTAPRRDLPSAVARRLTAVALRRPRAVVGLWLVVVALLAAAGGLAGTRTVGDDGGGVGQSGAAAQRLDAAHLQDPAREQVLVTAARLPDARAAAADLAHRLQADPPRRAGRGELVTVRLRGDPDDAGDHLQPVTDAVAAVGRAHPGARLQQAGDGSLSKAVDDLLEEDLGKVELLSLPLTLGILLVAFGAVVAASIPLLLGLTAVAGALGAFGLTSHLVAADPSATSLVVLIGLAVGVDYSLFAVRRFREERARGRTPHDAVVALAPTVGRATLVAGTTVAVALAGLLVTGMALFASMAIGTIIVVSLAVLASVTVLPAVLALTGDRVSKGAMPWTRRGRRPRTRAHTRRPALAARLAGAVTARPVAGLAVASAVLIALAVPALHLDTGAADDSGLPQDLPVLRSAQAITQATGGAPDPARIVVSGDGLDRIALARLGDQATAITGRGTPRDVEVRRSADGRTAVVSVPLAAAGTRDGRSEVAALRDDLDPARAGLPARADVLVGGAAASERDFTHRLDLATPVVVGLVLLLAFALLVAAFGSPLLAAAVIALDLASVGATYGVLAAWVGDGTVVSWIPLFVFVILFGISMDYTVLVLERIREARASGLPPRAAAAEGVAHTAGTVTSAATVMAVVFALFALMRLPAMQQLGVALAAGVVLDATLVRGIALPAVAALVPRRAWRTAPETAVRPVAVGELAHAR